MRWRLALAWVLFGGPQLLRKRGRRRGRRRWRHWTRHHWTTLVVGAVWVAAVVFLKVNLGLAAFAAAGLLVLVRAGDDTAMLRQVPWAVIVMVCGVSVLIGVLEGTGGLDLFSTALARIATPSTVNGVIAFITGAISTYSSTSGVVYPTFLPTVPALVEKLGGGDPLQIALQHQRRRRARRRVAALDDRRALHRGPARRITTRRTCSAACWPGACR